MNKYFNPKNEQDINEIFVFISKDENGEGIVCMMNEFGSHPLVFGYKRIADKFLEVAKQIHKDTGKDIYLCKFKKTEVIEKIGGDL